MRNVLLEVAETIDGCLLGGTAKKVKRERLTYLSNRKIRRLENELASLRTQPVAGEYMEFGVALGGSAILIAKEAKLAGQKFTGFDVFGMIPPPESEKDDLRSKARYQTIVRGESKGIGGDDYYGYRKDLYGDVVRTFSRYGIVVDGVAVSLVKGLFEETWPTRESGPIAFVHIDCDWYDPVKYCLNATAAKVPRNGVIMLDDYRDYGGCRLATDEFLKSHHEFALEDGANAILRRSPS